MSRYNEFEKAIFDWLTEKNRSDKDFTFSIRQQANKGAEDDYFIGTERSNYFATTFWYISVGYPGNASELISVVFKLLDQGYSYSFKFLQTKSPYNDQNKSGLKLVTKLKPVIKKDFSNFYEGSNDGKMESFGFNSPKPIYKSINELLIDFNTQLEKFIEVVDKEIESVKRENGEFIAHRITQQEFGDMLEKLEKRRSKYENAEQKIIPIKEGKLILEENKLDSSQQALNQILFGPPGTGKTYNTINKAIEIIDPVFYAQNKDDRAALKKYFKEFLISNWDGNVGQIAFITFHQNMSYEDFIEGIKPVKPKPNEPLKYDIEDGIFKRMCKKATSNYESSQKKNKGKIPFESAFEQLKEEWENDPSIKFPLKTKGYEFTIIGFTNTSIQFKKASGGTSHTLSINTLKEQYYGKEFNFQQGVGIYYPGILNKLESYNKDTVANTDLLNFVLIIDEINRGNISQIFGELITLIEDDKRIGNREELEAILPYSKENFSVPPNLFIVGTMNTADRSVESLDTALRRRFVFKEMESKPELLSPQEMIISLYNKYFTTPWADKNYRKDADDLYELLGISAEFEEGIKDKNEEAEYDKVLQLNDEDFSGVNLQKLLTAINNRVTVLLSKDHAIGHAWLMNVYSLEELKLAFKNRIYPLLQEYFYSNYAKIGFVLGDKFVDQKPVKKLFANFKDEQGIIEDYEDNIIYSLIDPTEFTYEDFKSIYE